MDEYLISEWQAKVAPGDLIYHLGDFTFYKDPQKIAGLLSRLPGTIHWIRGNHDYSVVVDLIKGNDRFHMRDYREINYNKTNIVLSHFPLFSWHKAHRGSIHLHGHCHGSIDHHNTDIRRTDVGWDAHGRILTLDEAVAMTVKKPIRTPDGDHHNPNRSEM